MAKYENQMSFRASLSMAAAAIFALATASFADPQLVMVEQPGCAYCAAWDDEIAPIYDKTSEGDFAPLTRAQLRDGAPEGMTYDRPVRFTPTFVLVDDGTELARIEGYPGEHFFFPLLDELLREHTDYTGENS